MFCSLTGAIAVAFFGFLIYKSYMETSEEEDMMDRLQGSFNNKVSAAGANIIIVILLCFFMGIIPSAIAAILGIVGILGLDYLDFL